jgi:hypothetical protein
MADQLASVDLYQANILAQLKGDTYGNETYSPRVGVGFLDHLHVRDRV